MMYLWQKLKKLGEKFKYLLDGRYSKELLFFLNFKILKSLVFYYLIRFGN